MEFRFLRLERDLEGHTGDTWNNQKMIKKKQNKKKTSMEHGTRGVGGS